MVVLPDAESRPFDPTPIDDAGAGPGVRRTHRRYSRINARLRVTGHLFQSRYGSVAMDEEHLMTAARYVALNPVRARLVPRAEDWRWSSVRAHLAGRTTASSAVAPILERCGGSLAELIASEPSVRSHSSPCARPRRSADRSARPPFSIALPPRPARGPRPKRRGAESARPGAGGELRGLSKVSPFFPV